MSSPSIPAQPAPPNYAEANATAIQTDISTLPLRNQINQAAQLGQRVTYTDPATGQQRTADFTGMGNAAAAQQAATILQDTNAAMQRQQLALRRELGVGNVQQTIDELRAADPQGYGLRQSLTARATDELAANPTQIAPSNNVRSAENRLWNIANDAPGASGRLGTIYDEATRLPGAVTDDPRSAEALRGALDRARREFELGGQLSQDEERTISNQARAGQVARGNYLGDAAAVQEGVAQAMASNERKQQRLTNLLDVQNRAFGQGQALRDESTRNSTNRLGMLSSLAGQEFGQGQQAYTTGLNAATQAFQGTTAMANDERQAMQMGWGRDQQRLTNAQALALGAPITNQFGSLGGAQQGAVGFTPVNYQQVGQTNPNAGAAGANFAQGNFGTQAGMWGTSANIAAQGNPWMSLLGNVAGAGAGAAAAMI